MNIFDYAMEVEKEGEELYSEFARSAPSEGISKIFNELAGQEKRHYEIFEKMKASQETTLSSTPFLDNVKNIFSDLKTNKDKLNFDIPHADLYRKALDIEKKSIDFYEGKAREVADDKQKENFKKIAKEERNHYMVVENIIKFITKPERWVEHAEFTKIGEEY